MSVFVLIPGAGGAAWYWHRVVPELRARGHEVVAVELPGADESAGLPEYTDAVVAAVGDHDDVVVVAQSMGGFTAPMVCARVPVALLVLVNAMIPLPGETPGAWWDNTGSQEARVAAAEAGATPWSSTWTPTSCTTCRPRSPPTWVSRAPKPRSPSPSPATSHNGPT